jgi:CheY-like chemotaxis protein
MHRILYVEDNADNVDVLTTWLELEVAAREAPDLVLMDLYLPVVDGFEATRQIKAQSQSRRIPIIALSAHALDEDRAKAYAAGCDDFEAKPIVFTRLVAKIRRLLAA